MSNASLSIIDTPPTWDGQPRRIEDYIPTLAPEAAARVNGQVALIRDRMMLSLEAARQIGARLAAVKEDVGQGNWLKALQCIGIKERAAQYYLSVYERFPALPPEVASRISPSAAYILSAAKVDEGTRQQAAAIAGNGVTVDEPLAKFLRDAPAPLVARFQAQTLTKSQALGLQKALRGKKIKPRVRKLAEETLTDPDVVPLLDAMPDEDVEVIAATGYLQGMTVIPASTLTARDIQRHQEDVRKQAWLEGHLAKREARLVCELAPAAVAGVVVNGFVTLKLGDAAAGLMKGDKVYVTIERMQS